MKTSVAQARTLLPGAPTALYPDGAPSVTVLANGSMQLKLFMPALNPDGLDRQQPHTQDELYMVHAGKGEIVVADQRHAAAPGEAFFVTAGQTHRFENFTPDFAIWVVFYGPQGGEKA